MIGHNLSWQIIGEWLQSDLRQPFVNVFHFPVPELSPLAPQWVLGQEGSVMLKVRAAAAGVGDDGVKLLGRELSELLSGQF